MPRFIDFMDVVGQLTQAGNNLTRYATVTRNEMARSLSGKDPLLYIVDVMTEQRMYISLQAYRLGFGYYGVRAYLAIDTEQVPLAIWTLQENSAPSDDAVCIRCLADCDGDTCPQADLSVEEVPYLRLSDTLVAWMRAQLKQTNFTKRIALA